MTTKAEIALAAVDRLNQALDEELKALGLPPTQQVVLWGGERVSFREIFMRVQKDPAYIRVLNAYLPDALEGIRRQPHLKGPRTPGEGEDETPAGKGKGKKATAAA